MESNHFSDVTSIISDSLRFKAKLAIGEGAFSTLRFKKVANDLYEVVGTAGTGAAIAKSSMVAAYFFAPQGLLGLIGIGTAVTPLGWVIAAAVVSGGAAFGVRRFLCKMTEGRVTVIPKFINTPIDVLALSLFDLIAPLAFKIGSIDGQMSVAERTWIKDYFVKEWGYDQRFIDDGCNLVELKIEEYSIKDVAEQLAAFCKSNPDCNYAEMTRDLIEFLKGVMEADGRIDEREEFAVAKIDEIFRQSGNAFTATIVEGGRKVVKSLGDRAEALGKVARRGREQSEQ